MPGPPGPDTVQALNPIIATGKARISFLVISTLLNFWLGSACCEQTLKILRISFEYSMRRLIIPDPTRTQAIFDPGMASLVGMGRVEEWLLLDQSSNLR